MHGRTPSRFHGLPVAPPSDSISSRVPREILLVVAFIFFNSVSFLLIQYDRMRKEGDALEIWVHNMLAGRMSAPDQYRIAMAYMPHWIELHSGLKPNQSMPVLQSIAYALALTLVYLSFRSSPHVVHSKQPDRIVMLGFLLAALQFPVLWIFPWERPETLPTAFYLAAIVLLVANRKQLSFTSVCLLAATLSLGQALMRAEVPVAVGFAILLAALLSLPLGRPRLHIAILGAICASVGAGVQIYMQRIVFPQTTYPPNVPKFQLLANLSPFTPPNHIPIFLTALLPFLVTLVLVRRNHRRIDAADKLVLLICLVYLPIWLTVGLVGEVRIFVPFLLLAAPTISKVWAAYLLNEADEDSFVHPTSPPSDTTPLR